MMTPEQIKAELADRNLKKVAEASGVSPATLYRFMSSGARPTYETVKALSDYLENKNNDSAQA